MVEIFAQSCSKNGEGGFTGNIAQDAGMGTISPPPIIVTKQLKEFSHILMSIDISKQVKQEDTWRIVASRAVRGIAISDNGSDKGKIDQ